MEKERHSWGERKSSTFVGTKSDFSSDIEFIGAENIVSVSFVNSPETYTRTKQLRALFAAQGEMLDEESMSLVQQALQAEEQKKEQPELFESAVGFLDIKIQERMYVQKRKEIPVYELTPDVLKQRNDLLQEVVQNFLQKSLLRQIEFLGRVAKKESFDGERILNLKDLELERLNIVIGVMKRILEQLKRDVFSAHDRDEKLLENFKSQISLYKDFLSTLRHDYRLLLGNMFSFTSLIQEIAKEDTERDTFKDIVLSAPEKLRDMLNGRILLIKDPDYKKHKVSDIIKESIEQLNGNAIGKTIIIENKGGESGEFFSDKARVDAWLHTFLINAVKFTPAGGSIIITSQQIENGYQKISVTDTGIGMPLAKLQQLQKILSGEVEIEKLESQEGANGEVGTGKGLINCQELRKKLVGVEFEVESEEGKGSTFSFIVPATEEQHLACLQEGGMEFEKNRKNMKSNVKKILDEEFYQKKVV